MKRQGLGTVCPRLPVPLQLRNRETALVRERGIRRRTHDALSRQRAEPTVIRRYGNGPPDPHQFQWPQPPVARALAGTKIQHTFSARGRALVIHGV